MMNIKKILREDWDDREYNAHEKYSDYKNEVLADLVQDILGNKKTKQQFRLAPIDRINKIWGDYSRTGIVRDEKGIDMIGDIFLKNIAMLAVNTELAGHTQHDPKWMLQAYDERLTPKQINKILGDKLSNYIEDYNGQLRISDYGLPRLEQLAFNFMAKDDTYEKKLLTLDMMLNVVHQRSDLSKLFVQGGTRSLDNLFTNEQVMKNFIRSRISEALKLKRFPLPKKNPEDPDQEVIVVTSDLPDPKAANNETYANKEALKKNGFTWDKFKKMWVTGPENLQAAQQTVNKINKKEEFVAKLEDLAQVVANSNVITDQGQLESKLTSYINDLANATDEKAADAAIRRYLTFQSKFHKYSFTNTILIWLQKENATKVAGRSDWKNKHNRYVVAGAQPIWIFRPLIAGGKDNRSTPEGEEELDKAVSSGRLMGFKAEQVFDISETKPFDESGEIPERPEWYSEENPTETTEKLYGYLNLVIEKLGIKLTTDKALGRERGYSAGGHINMTSPIKGAGEVSTLVHELAHELMHWKGSKFYQGEQTEKKSALMELQAESVSYTVMKHYNIPVQHHSTYITLWKGSKEEILNNMQPIQKVSKFIIDNIDEVAEGDQLTEDLYL